VIDSRRARRRERLLMREVLCPVPCRNVRAVERACLLAVELVCVLTVLGIVSAVLRMCEP
jgi:hypothetical protein